MVGSVGTEYVNRSQTVREPFAIGVQTNQIGPVPLPLSELTIHKNEFQIKLNAFSYAQLVRGYCTRASFVCSVRVLVLRTIHEFTSHRIRKMKWSIFAVFSVFLCAGRQSALFPIFIYGTHAGNGLMACEPEHCVADIVRSEGDATQSR